MELKRELLETDPIVMPDRNTRLHRKEIHGGYVYWTDDIAELNRVMDELDAVREKLEEETELIRLDNLLKERQVQIETKNEMYDEIARKIFPWSEKVSAKVRDIKLQKTGFEDGMRDVCLYGVFIKRYANMMLTAFRNADRIEAGEMHYAIAESLHRINESGTATECICLSDKTYPAGIYLQLYEQFEISPA